MIGPHLLTEIPGAYHVAVAHCADMRTLEELSHKAYTYGREGVRTEILTPRAAGK